MRIEKPPLALQVSCVQLHWAKPLEYNLDRCLAYVRLAAEAGSRVVVFPEANLTSYYFPFITALASKAVRDALDEVCKSAADNDIWVVAGTIERAGADNKYLNLAHVIDPQGHIVHQYAKLHMAGKDEQAWCRGGDKLSLFRIDGIACTLVICRDGRHPETYRIPAMAGAQVLFHPSCSSDEIEAVWWKRVSGRAQQPVGPNTRMFHCVANTVGQPPDGKQTSSGGSFIRDPNGLPLAEAGFYQEEMITAVLELNRADRSYAVDSAAHPAYLRPYWQAMIDETVKRADTKPE